MKKILHNFRIKHTRCRKDELHKSSLNVDIISKNLFNSQKINLLMSTTLFFENSLPTKTTTTYLLLLLLTTTTILLLLPT